MSTMPVTNCNNAVNPQYGWPCIIGKRVFYPTPL